ncbi:MAG: outer membrane lipoprotein LolB, partial [Pseudomonadales bacterium]|nr:outer membrane lipoprotein LolB [Pseudomonadales bacterium]
MHALRYWLIGLPYPDAPATQDFDETGRLSL